LNRNGITSWYLARTRPLCEYKAAAALESEGHDFFFPRVNTPKPRRGHDDTPLFPGYLFVRFKSTGIGLAAITQISGLAGWVEFDGEVPSVPDTIISELSRTVDNVNMNGGSWRRFPPGEMVRITSGWMDHVAKVLEQPQSPDSKVSVILHFMGKLVRASVPWKDLEPVNGGSDEFPSNRPVRRTRGKGRWIRGHGPRVLDAV